MPHVRELVSERDRDKGRKEEELDGIEELDYLRGVRSEGEGLALRSR